MRDIIVVSVDSLRYDFIDAMKFVSSFTIHTGITGAHYTRPSLASLLCASYRGAIESEVVSPTVAEAFADAGYTTMGLSSSPHTDSRLGFDTGFDVYKHYSEAGNRGNPIRQLASQFDPVRRIYHRIRPPHAKLANRLPDEDLVDGAIRVFNEQDSPRFMWLHFMGTHRPYGLGDKAVPKAIDRTALFSPEKLDEKEDALIRTKYRESLSRADTQIKRLVDSVEATDPLVVCTSDHGEEFGEDGYYFHQPQRRRLVDTLTKVPVAVNDESFEDPMSLIDVAPTLLGAVGADNHTFEAWHGTDVRENPRQQVLTIAPWHDQASMAWQNFETKILSRDAQVTLEQEGTSVDVKSQDIDADLERQMRDLGYLN